MNTASIVIPAFNQGYVTRKCLEDLFAVPSAGLGEVIVIDDGSTDSSLADVFEDFAGQIRVIRHATNLGFARACNDGAAAAHCAYLIFLNNDTMPQSGWLDNLINYADQMPEAMMVGAKLLFPNDTIQHAGVVICQDRYPRHIYAGFPANHPAVSKARRFQIVSAACALVRRAAFEQAGGFDDAFVNGYEDVDLCLRLGELGYQVHYCPDSVVYHLEATTRGDLPPELKQNDALYLERWAKRVRPDDVEYYLADGLLNFDFLAGGAYPARLSVSPLLALLDAEREHEAERLLGVRARQVFDLIKENIRLATLLDEARARNALH